MWRIFIIIIAVIIGISLASIGIIACIGIYYKTTIVKCKSTKRVDRKTVIVTGGTSGMGLEIAKELARRGAKVIIACPFQQKCIDARKLIIKDTGNEDVSFKVLNLGSYTSVRNFAEDVLKTEEKLHILVNNAGVLGPNNLTEDGLNFVMQVNYFGPFLLTILLLPLLIKTGMATEKARIINTTSKTHSMGTVTLGSMEKTSSKTYYNSKLCVAMFSRELSKKLEGTHVVVNTVDPGLAITNIKTGPISKVMKSIMKYAYPSAWDGAQTALHVALDSDAMNVSGEYFYTCKITKPAKKTYDEEVSKKLWHESISLTRLTDDELSKCFKY